MPPSSGPEAAVWKAFNFWIDREIRFDLPLDQLEIHSSSGERLLATLNPVEDTKGSGEGCGSLYITNLRIMWSSKPNNRRNISIGLYTVQSMEVKQTNSRIRGTTEALFIISKYSSSRFEFVFTYLVGSSLRLFATVPAVWRAYDSSRVYRELRLRTALMTERELFLLPGEELLTLERGVSNVSSDAGHIGTMFVTNLRLAWAAHGTPNLNASIPLMQLTAIRMQPTKFGNALVLETSSYAGSCVLGFRVDPAERLTVIFKEAVSLWKAWSARPVLGVAVVLEEMDAEAAETEGERRSQTPRAEPRAQDGAHVVKEVSSDAFAAYYADVGQKGADRRPEFDTSIGLAVEKLRTGVALRDLWAVVT